MRTAINHAFGEDLTYTLIGLFREAERVAGPNAHAMAAERYRAARWADWSKLRRASGRRPGQRGGLKAEQQARAPETR
jgi:hypothetical protein